MSSKTNFIFANSILNLNALTRQTTLTCQGCSVLNNSHQDIILFPGSLNLASGGVGIGNFGTYPLILQGVTSISTPLQTLTSSWSTLNTINPYQALVNSTTHYGLNPTNLPASYYLMINGSKCVHIDVMLALLIGLYKAMSNQLKAAGVTGFV